MSILAAAGMQKMESLSDSASKQTLNHAVRELNSKEVLTWALVKVSEEGWVSDETFFAKINTNLGEGYSWSSGPVLTGGTLRMRSSAVTMARTPSTANTVGNWEIKWGNYDNAPLTFSLSWVSDRLCFCDISHKKWSALNRCYWQHMIWAVLFSFMRQGIFTWNCNPAWSVPAINNSLGFWWVCLVNPNLMLIRIRAVRSLLR